MKGCKPFAMSVEDFSYLYETWRRITSPYSSNEELENLFQEEIQIWEIVHRSYRLQNNTMAITKHRAPSADVLFFQEEFQLLYDGLRELAKPYTHDQVWRLIRIENQIWELLRGIALAQEIDCAP